MNLNMHITSPSFVQSYRRFEQNCYVHTISTSEHSPKIYITPKKKPTNQTVVDLIDTFLAVVDNLY